MTQHPKLSDISEQIAEILGLSFPISRWSDLERGVLHTAKELGLGDSIDNFALWLSGRHFNANQLDILANHLTVGETYFFREKHILEIFQTQIIPELLAERFGKDQHINIWSAGCCSGEEPYTLAMLLTETIPDISRWKISILATDLNPSFLKKAREGIYSTWSFRETPKELQSNYFHKSSTGWQIDESIRKMVVFKQLNLAEPEFATNPCFQHPIDIIFCRNVLMYFSPELIRKVGLQFYDILMPNGWFITSSVELNDELFAVFSKVKFGNSIVYRKTKKNPVNIQPVSFGMKSPEKSVRQDYQNKKKTKPFVEMPFTRIPSKQNSEALSQELAEHLYKKKQYSDCAAMCRTEISGSASKHFWQMMLARSCANSGQMEEALLACNEMLINNRMDVELYYFKATILAERNELDEAEKILRQGFYLYPDHLMSHVLMAEIFRRRGNAKGASNHLKSIKRILSGKEDNVVLDEAGGLTVGRIMQMVEGQ